MNFEIKDEVTKGIFRLINGDPDFGRDFFRERGTSLLTIAWNRGNAQTIIVDGAKYSFGRNQIVCLMVNQTFTLEHPQQIIAWQFNREFYCIVNHDTEVSCAGLLFYGSKDTLFVNIDQYQEPKFAMLLNVFLDEAAERDSIQQEMLRTLLKRLIIKITRLYKVQHVSEEIPVKELDVIRQFNLLVENNYKTLHKVQDYADLLHKSPKTLANLFLLYNNKSPLQVIHERVCTEAKRMLLFTDRSTKEIAHEIGFTEIPHFSRFFRKMTGFAPGEFRQSWLNNEIGKN